MLDDLPLAIDLLLNREEFFAEVIVNTDFFHVIRLLEMFESIHLLRSDIV
jgi:hypothetical protein